MNDLTKGQRRHLRELAAIAYDRELTAALNELHGHFTRWQAGELDAWELNELIHQHHNGVSRDLYNFYDGSNPEMLVASALAREVLSWDEVREDCRTELTRLASFFKVRDRDGEA